MGLNEKFFVQEAGGGIITQNLELYYDITSTSTYNSGTTITDQSAQGNNGTINGGLNSATTTGGVRYLSFDGVNDYIDANSSIVDIHTTDFTVEFWINYQIVSGEDGWLFGLDQDDTQARWNHARLDLRTYSGGNKYQYWGWGNSAQALSSASGTGDDHLNEWVHVAFTLDVASASRKIYVNGSLLASNSGKTSASISSTFNMYIMAYHYRNLGAQGHLKSYLSKVRMYSSELIASDILSNFDIEKAYYGIT